MASLVKSALWTTAIDEFVSVPYALEADGIDPVSIFRLRVSLPYFLEVLPEPPLSPNRTSPARLSSSTLSVRVGVHKSASKRLVGLLVRFPLFNRGYLFLVWRIEQTPESPP
jgi:hypothetical protein